jgi:ABC-type nitrate/sulfonate/bicarbonate transport system substrate-binding protein
VTVKLISGQTLGGWVMDVADKQGFFAAQGIALDKQVEDPGSNKATGDVVSRARDVGVLPTDRFMREAKDGQALVMVGGLVNKVALSLIAARDMPDLASLKGQPIGYGDPEDVNTAVIKRFLKARGFADSDVQLVSFPDPGVVGAAVANGTVGASFVGPAQSARLRTSGFQWIGEATDVVKDFQSEGIVVRPDWARQNEETLVRLLRAVVLAERWITTPANHDPAVAILADTLHLTPQEAAQAYDQYVEKSPSIPPQGDIDQAGVRAVGEMLAEIGVLKPPLPDPVRLTDTAYLQRARGGTPSPSPAPSASPSVRSSPPVGSPLPSPSPANR